MRGDLILVFIDTSSSCSKPTYNPATHTKRNEQTSTAAPRHPKQDYAYMHP